MENFFKIMQISKQVNFLIAINSKNRLFCSVLTSCNNIYVALTFKFNKFRLKNEINEFIKLFSF